jgi:hypothetical protein
VPGTNNLHNELNTEHIKVIIEALTHKYTMRSKAHKKILNYFLNGWILGKSELALAILVVREEPVFTQ